MTLLPVKYPCGEHSKPGDGPDEYEHTEDSDTESVELGVVEELGQLQEDVSTVVSEENQGPAPWDGDTESEDWFPRGSVSKSWRKEGDNNVVGTSWALSRAL